MTDWNHRYSEGQLVSEQPDPLLIRFAANFSRGRALDLACGPGRHAIWLARQGWKVTAVDSSRVAIEILEDQVQKEGVAVNTVLADLERHEFGIEPELYDLILVCNYLQRDLFPWIRAGTRVGGVVIAIIAMVDEDPDIRPMNPAYLEKPGELKSQFDGWELIHEFEGKPLARPKQRARAEIVARKLI